MHGNDLQTMAPASKGIGAPGVGASQIFFAFFNFFRDFGLPVSFCL